jgi:O-antigen/teichoic acid export membrane protein
MQLFLVIDRALIQLYLGFELTGLYAGAYDIIMKLYALLYYPIAMATHPRIMQAWNRGDAVAARRTVYSALALQGLLFVPIVTAYAIVGDALLAWLVPGYATSIGNAAVPLAIGGLLWQAALMVHKGLEMEGATRFMLAAMILALVTNTVVALLGLPRFGVIAAPFATIAAAACYVVLCLGYYIVNSRVAPVR